MRIEQASDPVRAVGERLFDFIDGLTGTLPRLRESDEKCYVAECDGRAFLWVHFYGERAQGSRQSAVVLNTQWDERLEAVPGAEPGNEFHGVRSVSLSVRPGVPEEIERAKQFIRLAREIRDGR